MARYTARNGWRWLRRVRAVALVLVTASAAVPWGGTAQASVSFGALRLTVTKVVAGAAGDTLGWTYSAPLLHKVTGTISLDVPAAFAAPQTGAPGSPGYVATTSGCAQFQVTGTAPQNDGSTVITIAVSCAKGLTGAISYSPGTVPTVAGKYPFAATFTPAGGTAAPFRQGDIVTVKPGPLASLVISPASSAIATGATQTYTVQGLDAFGNSLGNLTGSTTFTISPDGSCGQGFCTASINGPHTVTATKNGVTTTAALTVATLDADLSVTQTVTSTTPYYYAPITFQTTVTNTSTLFVSYGISATVAEPSGLANPAATASGSTSYDPATGVWTIGSLAPGASVTLDISGDAGDVSDGTQTVTATVTATTPDSNPANNTAAASEASQPAPFHVVITPDPNNMNPIDICATPQTNTWYGSTVNAANPAAPPPIASNLTYSWVCTGVTGPACPAPVSGGGNATYISFTTNTFVLDEAYDLILRVVSGTGDPNYQSYQEPATDVVLSTICVA